MNISFTQYRGTNGGCQQYECVIICKRKYDMSMQKLLSKIYLKRASIGVIGLGYVGLPLAVLAAKKGFRVTGFVRNERKIEQLKQGISSIESVNKRELKKVIKNSALTIAQLNSPELDKQDIYFICVPTPVDEEKNPDLTPIHDVSIRLARIKLDGKLIINESTVAPGTTREEFGHFEGKYFLAFSPERIDPGNTEKSVATITKVVGGIDKESSFLTQKMYSTILVASTVAVSSPEAAETVKMLENTYRAVNIGLINEFALLAEKNGLDILEIIEAAKTKWSYQAHYPSLGVGGHCIPVDPWYLVEYGKKKSVDLPIIIHGLKENDSMAKHIADKIMSLYKSGMKVLIYGVTYKKNVKDLRESPVIRLARILKNQDLPFVMYDPLMNTEEIKDLGFVPGDMKKVDMFIVGSDHDLLKKEFKKFISPQTIVIDGKNFFHKKVGRVVHGIGRTLI